LAVARRLPPASCSQGRCGIGGAGELSAAELALGRYHAYTLLGRLFLEGMTAEIWPYVVQVPQLAAAVREGPHWGAAAREEPHWGAAVPEEGAHYGLFGLQIFPYESFFLGERGLLGGAVTAAVQGRYAEAGFAAGGSTAVDHAGHELAFLAFLCRAEAEAGAEAQAVAGRRQELFLAEHLLRWLSPLVVALQRHSNRFYAALAKLTWELVADHYRALKPAAAPAFTLPAPRTEPPNGLKETANLLTTPAHSGLFLGREEVRLLARPLNLPTGFGGRRQMAQQLLEAAARYDSLSPLRHQLSSLLAAWRHAYAQLSASDPHLAPFISPWQQRLEQTAQRLQQLDMGED
jgi:putative dimethyl sulfoxide reductase chaperone